MIHNVKLLWAFSFVTGMIALGVDTDGYPDALAMSLVVLLISAAYVLLAAVDRTCFRSRSKRICGEITHDT
jgi:hypothetical protein